MATVLATGIETFTEDGRVIIKWMVYFQTLASFLVSLDEAAVIYYWNVDTEGNAEWELWLRK